MNPSKRRVDEKTVKSLEKSMARDGLHHPITVNEDFELLAGKHRLSAARNLGWVEIMVEIVPTDDIRNQITTLEENLFRKNLSVLEQAEHLERLEELLSLLGKRALRGDNQYTSCTCRANYIVGETSKGGGAYCALPQPIRETYTTSDIASEIGMSERTVQERVKIARDLPEDVRNLIRDNPVSDNKSELLRLIRVKDPVDQMKVAERVVNGAVKTVKESIAEIEREKHRARYVKAAGEIKKLQDGFTLVAADFFEYEEKIPDNSIDLIVTDPPYIAEFSECIAPFLTIANRVLKAGGALVLVIGHARLPEVFEGFRECKVEFGDDALEFYHICALAMSGKTAAMHYVGAQNGFKPVIIGMKSPLHKPYRMYNDLLTGSGREKDAHDWQQSAEELLPLIDAFSPPGGIILDPFVGTGTYGIAAKMRARKFIGVDIDGENVKVAKARIYGVKAN